MVDNNLLALIGRDSVLRKVASTKGGEYAGPCPFCGGRDRLRVWPEHKGGSWWCRQCGKGGDAIAYLVERGDLTPAEAGKARRGDLPALGIPTTPATPTPRHPDRLAPPGQAWQAAARGFVTESAAALWAPTGARALAWLRGRGLTDETIHAAGLGYNAQDRRPPRAAWGLDGDKPVWLPRGIVIPWMIDGALWRVNIRRPQGEPKYFSAAGHTVALYNADALSSAKPAILVEGEFDALTLGQVAGDLVTPVATGSTGGSRRPRWLARLAVCPSVLVAYDADGPGEKAAAWWVEVLANSRRWRPFWGDANAMHQDGADLRAWVAAALDEAPNGDLDRRLDALETGIATQGQRLDKLATEHGLDTPAPQRPETAPGPGTPDKFPAAAITAPPWAGQRVRIDDLPEFKARWGLQTVASDWPEGQPFPVVGLAEVRKHDET